MDKLIDSVLLTAVGAAILWSVATAYTHGFLVEAGISVDMLERSFHIQMYRGLILLVHHIPYLLLCAVILSVPYIALLKFAQKRFSVKRKIVKLIQSIFSKKPRFNFNTGIDKFLLLVLVSSTAFLALFLTFPLIEGLGRAEVKELLANHFTGKDKDGHMISVKIDNEKKELRYLTCGSKNCAGIEEKTNRIFHFPQSSGYSFVYTEKNEPNASGH